MKILHVVHAYHPSKGGSQWLTQQLAERCVRDHGDEATVFTTTAIDTESFWQPGLHELPAGEVWVNGVHVRRFAIFNRLRWLRKWLAGIGWRLRLPANDWLRTLEQGPLCLGLRKAIVDSRPDVIFATAFPLFHMYDALAGAKRSGSPVVMLGALHLNDHWGYARANIYKAIAQSSHYIAHTEYERQHLLERGIDPSKISVIGAGVDATQFAAANGDSLRLRYGWGDAPVVATLGKQVARKRFDRLLAAMQRVWVQRPDVKLLIAGGRGSYTPQLTAQIAALPPQQRGQVTLLHDISEAEKPTLLAAADIFALPSPHESFGIAFVEAWACKKPVIGAQSGAIAALIEDGVDGLLTPPADDAALAQALQCLIDNPALRRSLGEAGFSKVMQRYTWPAVTSQVRNVYKRLAE
jgi:glycosyltransferase involved in cell wall biosynthesis